MVKMRSTKRQPSTLLLPKLRFRHSAGSNANRFSQKAATVLSSPKIAPFEQDLLQPVPDRLQLAWQLCPRGLALLERMPRGKDLFDDSPPRPAHRLAGAAPVHDLLKDAFPVGPADLA